MLMQKIMISAVLSTLLLLQGCGGGGSSGATVQPNNVNNMQVPINSAERTVLYNQKVQKFSEQAAVVKQQLDSMLADASHNYTVLPEDMQKSDFDRFYANMNAALPEYAKLLLLANDVATIENKMNSDVTYKKGFILRAILVSGVIVGIAGMYKWVIDSNNERIGIMVKMVANATPKELIAINKKLGIDQGSTKKEALNTVNHLGYINAMLMAGRFNRLAITRIGEGSSEKYATQFKDQFVKTVKKAAKVAVTTTAGLELTAVGGQGVDKAVSGAAKLLGSTAADAELIGATTDLVISAKGKDPLSIISKHITVVTQSKSVYKKNIEAGKKNLQGSLSIIQKSAAGTVPANLNIKELADASNSVMQNVVLKSGQGEKNPDGSVTAKIPYRASITTVKNVKNEDTKIPVLKNADANVVLVAESKKPEIIKDVAIDEETTIKTELKDIKVIQQDMTVSASKTASDSSSITYKVTATLTGIVNPTTVKISLSNASTGSSMRSLSKDGSVSWMVTVLDKDASVTITRLDNGESNNLSLKGTGVVNTGEMVDVFVGKITSVYNSDPKNTFCLESVDDEWPFFIDANGNIVDKSGIIGSISGDQLDMSYEEDHFSGSISGGTWTDGGNCSGKYEGHYATLTELYQMKNDCKSDSECVNSNDYQNLINIINSKQ